MISLTGIMLLQENLKKFRLLFFISIYCVWHGNQHVAQRLWTKLYFFFITNNMRETMSYVIIWEVFWKFTNRASISKAHRVKRCPIALMKNSAFQQKPDFSFVFCFSIYLCHAIYKRKWNLQSPVTLKCMYLGEKIQN